MKFKAVQQRMADFGRCIANELGFDLEPNEVTRHKSLIGKPF